MRILRFPDAPIIKNLDWLKTSLYGITTSHGEEPHDESDATVDIHARAGDLHSFFKWHMLTNITQLGTPEHKVARALLMKYQRRIYGQDLWPMEVNEIEEAEQALRNSNAAIKARKANPLSCSAS